MSLGERGYALEVTIASAIECNVKYLVTEDLELDRLRADSFRLSYNRPYSTAKCIVYYLHHVSILQRQI